MPVDANLQSVGCESVPHTHISPNSRNNGHSGRLSVARQSKTTGRTQGLWLEKVIVFTASEGGGRERLLPGLVRVVVVVVVVVVTPQPRDYS